MEFDSVIIPDKNLKPGQKRSLDVDNRIVIPENATIRLLITACDVIHSFAVPSLGFKIDAVPCRINETWTRVAKKGVYYGQCSELCGVSSITGSVRHQEVELDDCLPSTCTVGWPVLKTTAEEVVQKNIWGLS